MKKYTLRYLPLAEQDLAEIIDYIQNNLQSPIAAENTLSKIEDAKDVRKIVVNCESLSVFPRTM